MVNGYCVKCKKKGVKLNNPVINKTAKGGYMAKGKCSNSGCTTTVCAMMSEVNAKAAISSGEAKKGF